MLCCGAAVVLPAGTPSPRSTAPRTHEGLVLQRQPPALPAIACAQDAPATTADEVRARVGLARFRGIGGVAPPIFIIMIHMFTCGRLLPASSLLQGAGKTAPGWPRIGGASGRPQRPRWLLEEVGACVDECVWWGGRGCGSRIRSSSPPGGPPSSARVCHTAAQLVFPPSPSISSET